MTDQKNKKKICWKSKLQAVCTLKATCSISLVCTFIKLARAKCVQMSEWSQTPRSFFHVFSDSRFSSFFSSDSRFSQVCGSRLHARYRLLPGLPIYLASSLPNPTTRIQLLIKTIPTREEPDSGAPTASNRRRFFSSNPNSAAPPTIFRFSLSIHRINADMDL